MCCCYPGQSSGGDVQRSVGAVIDHDVGDRRPHIQRRKAHLNKPQGLLRFPKIWLLPIFSLAALHSAYIHIFGWAANIGAYITHGIIFYLCVNEPFLLWGSKCKRTSNTKRVRLFNLTILLSGGVLRNHANDLETAGGSRQKLASRLQKSSPPGVPHQDRQWKGKRTTCSRTQKTTWLLTRKPRVYW